MSRAVHKKRSRSVAEIAFSGPPAAALLNETLTRRLQLKREYGVDVFEYYGSELDEDLAFLDVCYEKLEALDPNFVPDPMQANAPPHSPADADALTYWSAKRLEVEQRMAKAHARHTKLRNAVKPDSPIPTRKYVRVSWVLLCSFVLLQQQLRDMFDHNHGYEILPHLTVMRAMDFAYVRAVTDHHCVLALSDDPIGLYSLQLLMTAAALLCEALDNFGWTATAGDYLRALYLRYCLFVRMPHEFAGDTSDFGQWEAPPPDRTLAEPLLAPAPIMAAFLDVGERLFYLHAWHSHAAHEMWHANASTGRLQAPLDLPLHQRRAAWRCASGLPALTKLLAETLEHEAIGEKFRNDFGSLYPARLIWPGQREQLLFEYPLEAQDARPDAVLFRLRIVQYKALMRSEKEGDLLDHITAYVKHEIDLCDKLATAQVEASRPSEALTEGDWLDAHVVPLRSGFDVVRLVDPLRAILLMFELAFEMHSAEVRSVQGTKYFVQHAYVDDRTLDGTRGRPCPNRRALQRLREDSDWPLFLAIWYNYTVAAPRRLKAAQDVQARDLVHTTGHLVDALGLWLALARRAPVSGKILADCGFFDGEGSTKTWAALVMPLELVHG